MRSEIVFELSSFLGALDYQVETWDSKVIDHLASNPSLFTQFRKAGDITKWDIYSTAKHN